jgi:hypothetical protein
VISFLLGFTPISYIRSSYLHSCYMSCSSQPPWLHHSNYTWRRVQVIKVRGYIILYPSTLKMEATGSSKIQVTIFQIALCHNPENHNLNLHRCDITWAKPLGQRVEMETHASSLGRAGIILFAARSRLDLGPTKRPRNGCWKLFRQGSSYPRSRLTTHLHLMEMLRTHGAISLLPLHLNDVVIN